MCYALWVVVEMNENDHGRLARRSKLTTVKRGKFPFFLITWSPVSWLSILPTWSSNHFVEYQWVFALMWKWVILKICLHAGISAHLSAFFFNQFVDYLNYIRSCCMKDIPVLERSIALCNGISQWVQLMVLSRPTAQLRAEVFTKFIHVAQVVVNTVPVSNLTLSVYSLKTLETFPLCMHLQALADINHWAV